MTDNYLGNDIHTLYAIDPINGEEVFLDFNLDLSKQDVKDAYDYKKIPQGSQEAAVGIPLSIARKNEFDAELSKQITEATNYAFDNCGVPEGGDLDAKDLGLITHLIFEKLTPFLVRHMPNSRIPLGEIADQNGLCNCGSGKRQNECCLDLAP